MHIFDKYKNTSFPPKEMKEKANELREKYSEVIQLAKELETMGATVLVYSNNFFELEPLLLKNYTKIDIHHSEKL